MCCRKLTERITEKHIFDSVSCFEKFKTSWELCVKICTDGGPSMISFIKEFITFTKNKISNIISTHCFLHRESLISKILPTTLKSVLEL